jgi:hypothetical protein
MAYTLFYDSMRFLKKVVRSNKPVKVRRMKLTDDVEGLCIEKSDHFLIKVSNELTMSHAIDVMIHEFAHVEAWGKQRDAHGSVWGKCYSRLFREYYDGFLAN